MHSKLEVDVPNFSGGQQAPLAVTFSVAQPVQQPAVKEIPVQQEVVEPEHLVKPPQPETPKKPVAKKVAKEERVEPKVQTQAPQPEAEQEPVQQEKMLAAVASTAVQTEQVGLDDLPVVTQAQFREQPRPPVYPKTALKRKQQGSALVQVLVNELGETEKIELVETSGYVALDKSALKAVAGWAFDAARVDGKPIRAWVEVPVVFQIN